jgi:hypothetical protein
MASSCRSEALAPPDDLLDAGFLDMAFPHLDLSDGSELNGQQHPLGYAADLR